MWKIDENAHEQQVYDMLTPTAPEWSSDDDAPAQDLEVQPAMIQCTVHPAHATHSGVWMLTVMGAVTASTMMVVTVIMIWMAAQGYAITGVWLTITPTGAYHRKHDDDMALQ